MIYFYKAKSLEGKEESGYLEAQDKQNLSQLLRSRSYFLIFAQEKTSLKNKKFFNFNFLKGLFSVSIAEKLFFTRNLGVMVKTGVSLPRAFEILAKQSENKKFKEALFKISERIVKGETMSSALKEFPDIFPVLYQETLKVGEETGKLEESLKILGLQLEREHNLKSKIKAAMTYPLIILILAFVIGVLMMIFTVPPLKDAFQELNVALPLTTRLILSSSDFLLKKWFFALPIAAGILFVLILFLKSASGKKIKSNLSLKLPFLSKITKQLNSALMLKTLGSLLKAGVPVVRALEITAGALSNPYFQESLKNASLIVEKGKKISEALSDYTHLYSPMVLQMMEIGEETGETSAILEKLADFYDEEVTLTTQKISSVIEPLLIAFIGIVVGFFAVSMVQPMFSIMEGIK